MPIATPEVYAEMLGRAKEHSFAFPAINCVGSESVNAALKGFADAGSDGIIQFSTGGAEFGSGLGVKDMVTGAVALAEFAHIVAEKYPITVALHTTTARRTSWTATSSRCWPSRRSGSPPPQPAVPVAHGTVGGAIDGT
jgi:fructose/tagatose bisphosphate aldolase